MAAWARTREAATALPNNQEITVRRSSAPVSRESVRCINGILIVEMDRLFAVPYWHVPYHFGGGLALLAKCVFTDACRKHPKRRPAAVRLFK